MLGPGDYFGELSLFDPAPRDATITAVGPLSLVALSRVAFMQALDEIPTFRDSLLHGMARRLHELDQREGAASEPGRRSTARTKGAAPFLPGRRSRVGTGRRTSCHRYARTSTVPPLLPSLSPSASPPTPATAALGAGDACCGRTGAE